MVTLMASCACFDDLTISSHTMNFIRALLGRQNVSYMQLPKAGEEEVANAARLGVMLHKIMDYTTYALLPVLLAIYFDYGRIWKASLILLTLVVFLATLYQLQDRLLYHPDMPPTSNLYVASPSHVSYEVVNLTTVDNVKLHGFFLKHASVEGSLSVSTVVFFHGNAGNAGSPCILPIHMLCKVNVLAVDYRGYGRSSGYPSENGLYIDGKTCVDYLLTRSDVDPNKIVLFGHSMGGAVAIHLASRMQESGCRIAALIVENTFTSIPDAAKHIFNGVFPLISKLPICCYKNKFLSINKIGSVNVPILFICGEKDEILNPDMTRRLQRTSENQHTILLRVPNGSHNDTWCSSRDYHTCITAFLRKVFNDDLRMDGVSSDNVTSFGMSLTWNGEVVAV